MRIINTIFFFAILFVVIVIIVNVMFVARRHTAKVHRAVSSDGHVVPVEQDLTCESMGHRHQSAAEKAQNEREYGRRYVVHNDPEMGYVILNGVKRKLTDCKNL